MTRTKSTRRALLASLLALVVSISMLVGTTFAWFTDSVTSGRNIIQTGNLDIELEYFNGTDWVAVDEKTNTFGYDNWEPGFTKVVSFRVTNKGSLALKYQLTADVYAETAGVNKDGDSFLLSDYLYTAVVATDADRDTILATKGVNLKDSYQMSAKSLEKGTSEIVALAIWMPTEVDNVANHDGVNKPSIEFGINLVATQEMSESDSFGKDYDDDAIYTDIVVDDEDGFKDALADAKNDAIIGVRDNIEWETGASHGSTPFGVPADVKNITIVGITSDATFTATGSGVGPIGIDDATVTFKNLKIVDNSVSYAEGSWEFGYLEFRGNVVFENCEFVNAVMMEGDSATFKNCTFNSNKDSEYAVWVSNGSAYFNNCTFAGPRALKMHEAYGTEVDTVIVDSCIFDNIAKKPGVAIGTVNADTTVVIKNSDFINCQAGDQGKYIYETDTDVAAFNFDCSENNEIIKSVTPDLVITTADELFAFAKSVNEDGNSYAGKLVVLGANIDLDNAEWTPIGQTGGNGVATYFQGMFDGKGFTVSNLKITDNAYDEGANYAAGFFGFIDAADAQIVNLIIDGAEVNGHHWTGVIAGYISGKISGCTVKNATVKCTHANEDACGDKAGVITGYVNSGVVTGNTVKDCSVTAGRDAGQVVGAAKTTQAYSNIVERVTVAAAGDCTGANIRNEEIGRVL